MTVPMIVRHERHIHRGSHTLRRVCVVKQAGKSVKKTIPPECPYDPHECASRFDALEASLETVENQLSDLRERVDKLPNGQKLELILNYVSASATRLDKISPKVEIISQRVDEAMRVADLAAKRADEVGEDLDDTKKFRDVMLTEVITRLQRIEGAIVTKREE